jgi:hypothetical protein
MRYPIGTGALVESKNFEQNHLFLIEAWEAMYRACIETLLMEKGLHSEATMVVEVKNRMGNMGKYVGDEEG